MTWKVKIINGIPVKFYNVVVHSFKIGDVDDPEMYAAQPIWEWQQTDSGKYIMEHATDNPEYHQQFDVMTYGYQFIITATLKEIDYTYWSLKHK